MRPCRSLLLAALCLVAACGARTTPPSRATAPANADTSAVRAFFLDGITAFNAHDLDRFTAQFAPDVDMYTPTGWQRGHAAVRERFAATFRQFPSVRMETDSLRVRTIGPATVLVDFRWRVYPLGQGPAFHGVGSGTYIRRGKRWLEVVEHETVTRVDPELQHAGAA